MEELKQDSKKNIYMLQENTGVSLSFFTMKL